MTREEAGGARAWIIQAVLLVFAVYFYIFMEWLFFATKPSFMSTLGMLGRLKILWATPAPFAPAGIAVVALCSIPALLAGKRTVRAACLTVAQMVTSVVLAAAIFLMVDNFTYTLFHFGVRSTAGLTRLVYAAVLGILLVFSFGLLDRIRKAFVEKRAYRFTIAVAAALVVISALTALAAHGSVALTGLGGGGSLKERPNILLLSSDGLNADHMSVYGYHRETTPFLDKLADRALICENCFTNAGTSGASIASMLTGKLPTETGLIYPPDILTGIDAYQHLPGILRNYGYYNVDISIRLHGDPEDLNLRSSFHWANFRELGEDREGSLLRSMLGQGPSYFFTKMRGRITERLLHLAGRRRMEDPLGEVVRLEKRKYGRDAERVKTFFNHVRTSPYPLFVHMHLLGTHGPTFKPVRQIFSRGVKQDEPWMTDFYDDAILAFDNQVKTIVRGLQKRGLLDRTLIAIFTDHGQNFTVNNRLPLIFLFPGGRHRGRIPSNVQYLDIAPTVLDYLGIERPGWMSGLSLISPGITPGRFIFTADPKHRIIIVNGVKGVADRGKPGPPFYSLKAMGIHCCHRYFELGLEEAVLNVIDVAGHTAPCDVAELPDPREVGRLIIDHLDANGYDTSSLGEPIPVRTSPRSRVR
jgi:hypothetical protein